jgi:branched-chain amino acid transport system ATP-binding protein
MMLRASAIVADHGVGPVLHGIDLDLAQGEIVTLLGANGAGKSTLLQVLSGLLRPSSGQVLLDGRAITQHTPAERLASGLCHVPEARQVFAGMSVAENLALGGRLATGAVRAARLGEIRALFPVLDQRMHDMAGNLSGGQQQMLAIARGLMSGPRLLMLDEPSLGLSPLLVAEMFRLVQRLREGGLTILLAEQNARAALGIADRGYVLESGRIVLSGDAPDLLRSPEITERYLGGRAVQSDATQADGLARRLAALVA